LDKKKTKQTKKTFIFVVYLNALVSWVSFDQQKKMVKGRAGQWNICVDFTVYTSEQPEHLE
jgi:hypothetical protein